jgi:hypothetical protein
MIREKAFLEARLFIPMHQPTNIIIEVCGGIPRLDVYMHV